MDHKGRFVIAAAAVIGLGAGGQNGSGQPAARMTVHLVDYARIASDDLTHAQREAAEIYAAAGIELVWVLGRAEDHPPTGLDVHVVLLDGAMSAKKLNERRLSDDVLGVGSQAGWAYVFANRVALRSVSAGACFSRVLGRVMAHEIGHLVLPAQSHTPTGIMRVDVDMRPRGNRYFTQSQAVTLQRTLTRAN
jgi:hypothetical protein